ARLSGNVFNDVSFMNTSANANSFQKRKKASMDTVDNAGTLNGSMILKKIPQYPLPSMTAASSRSLGIDPRYAITKKIDIGRSNAVYGNINAQSVFNNPIAFIIVNHGTNVL